MTVENKSVFCKKDGIQKELDAWGEAGYTLVQVVEREESWLLFFTKKTGV